jgi:hypothetical protein
MDKSKKLQEIFNNDPLGLLETKTSVSPARNEEERLIASFQEIIDFYDKNNREPDPSNGVQEYTLYARLKFIKENPIKLEMLTLHDKFGLLQNSEKQINSLNEIFEDDEFGLLSDDSQGIFDLKNVQTPTTEDRVSADFIARRKPCKDFDRYEALFKEVQADLVNKKRTLNDFHERSLQEGHFYVSNGVLLLFEVANFEEKRPHVKGSSKDRRDGRTRVIFENGTESNMLFRSLYKALLINGKTVSENIDNEKEDLYKNFSDITEEDKEAGFIYILKSKSEKLEIKEIKHLYKIGFSKIPVEERVKNANQDPTFLMADVRIVMAYKCFNMNPQKLEQLLHNFFGNSCLNIDIFDQDGKRCTPREWFVAPLSVIEQAIHMIINGDIVSYKYDAERQEILDR